MPEEPAHHPITDLEAFWERVDQRIASARASGHLHPIETHTELVDDGGVRFAVRALSSLRRKDLETKRVPDDFNPFLPPDPALLVTDLAPHHRAVLNKYPVLDRHVLIVTADFEDQTSPLELADFEALLRVLPADGLGFYNAGRLAGASQRHKHLQVVPLPLADGLLPEHPGLPIEAAIGARLDRVGDLGLPFPHAGAWWREPGQIELVGAAERLHVAYVEALDRLGLGDPAGAGDGQATRPYNLLVTHRWLVVVPRCAGRFDGLSVNALGYAGALLVRDAEQIERVRQTGPLRILRELASAPPRE